VADPIQSFLFSTPANACVDSDTEPTDLVCQNPAPTPAAPVCSDPGPPSESSSAVQGLVDRFGPTNTPSLVQGKPLPVGYGLPTPPTDNSAYRTTVRQDMTPYLAAGKTEDGDSVYAGAALVKAHLPGDHDLELLSASGQVGIESELQAAVGRGTVTSGMFLFDASVSAEALSARANIGIQNDDGSVGANVGANAEVVGAEVTPSRSGWSATFGLSISAGASGSIGFRDADGDGRGELCAKLSVPLFTAGLCAERFW
jgi:hypothetical protein